MSATLVLVIITSIISIFCFSNKRWFDHLKHYPLLENQNKQYYRWLTSGFVHGSYIHLFVNMFVLHEFGRTVEDYLIFHFGYAGGIVLFTFTYLLIIVMGDIPTYFKNKENYSFASVGASGGVSGIIFIYILLFPWHNLYLFAIVPLPAILFGVLYLWYSTWASKNQNDMIDHEAHFYGAVAGILIAIITRPDIIHEFITHLVNEFPL
ncbi:MAG: rhomboid family intramembrane serine protease [Saprospiraceae bacterium]|nr:rhomboid family intramembrane serine protease [Saprospiraceae bacterium]MBL0027484.1 rhomboid family intramembrane serine protease [Saprospiraceae bacterium]